MANAKSYDPRMENMPVLISYPRSGSNWLNSIMELYFDRPRLRLGPTSFLKNREQRNDFMWFHDHDIYSDLKLTHNNILYLYRNPCDVIFSLLMAEHDDINHNLVNTQIDLIQAHHKKYLCGGYTSICYEKCKDDLTKEFGTILTFFKRNEEVNVKKLSSCADKANKPALIAKAVDKRYFNRNMMSAEYERRRGAFRDKYEAYIYDRLEWK
jgi:hypothetical protein